MTLVLVTSLEVAGRASGSINLLTTLHPMQTFRLAKKVGAPIFGAGLPSAEI